jgi:hypothetical protein
MASKTTGRYLVLRRLPARPLACFMPLKTGTETRSWLSYQLEKYRAGRTSPTAW